MADRSRHPDQYKIPPAAARADATPDAPPPHTVPDWTDRSHKNWYAPKPSQIARPVQDPVEIHHAAQNALAPPPERMTPASSPQPKYPNRSPATHSPPATEHRAPLRITAP